MNSISQLGETALMRAVDRDDKEAVRLLVVKGRAKTGVVDAVRRFNACMTLTALFSK
jgi:hypothetical protein